MSLRPGRWDLSTPYNSTQPLRFRIQPRGEERDLDLTLPANLDRPGARWPIGTLVLDHPTALDLTITVGGSGLSAAGQIGYPNAVIATQLDGWHTVPLRKACGRYVDWYQTPPGA